MIVPRKLLMNHQLLNPVICSVRNRFSNLYPGTKYIEPEPSKKKLAIMEMEGQIEPLKVLPVHPAPNTMSDSIFYDPLLVHFTNLVMMWAERTLARKLMSGTFARIKRIQLAKYHAAPKEEKALIELNPLVILKQAIANCQPVLGLTAIKKGGITYQVPVPITPQKSQFMAMKWIVMSVREDKESEISFEDQMARELLDAFHKEGKVIKRKQDLHKVCENNKAYAHYRWS